MEVGLHAVPLHAVLLVVPLNAMDPTCSLVVCSLSRALIEMPARVGDRVFPARGSLDVRNVADANASRIAWVLCVLGF